MLGRLSTLGEALNNYLRLLSFIDSLNLCPLFHLEFRDVEAVHIVNVRVEPSGEAQTGIERLAAVLRETLPAKLEASIDELDIGPLAERIVHHGFILVDSHGACRIDNVSAVFRFWIDTVDSAQNELFLKVGKECKVAFGL